MVNKKTQTSYALTEDGKALLRKTAEALGLTLSGTMELAVREFARRNKIKLTVQPVKEQKLNEPTI